MSSDNLLALLGASAQELAGIIQRSQETTAQAREARTLVRLAERMFQDRLDDVWQAFATDNRADAATCERLREELIQRCIELPDGAFENLQAQWWMHDELGQHIAERRRADKLESDLLDITEPTASSKKEAF